MVFEWYKLQELLLLLPLSLPSKCFGLRIKFIHRSFRHCKPKSPFSHVKNMANWMGLLWSLHTFTFPSAYKLKTKNFKVGLGMLLTWLSEPPLLPLPELWTLTLSPSWWCCCCRAARTALAWAKACSVASNWRPKSGKWKSVDCSHTAAKSAMTLQFSITVSEVFQVGRQECWQSANCCVLLSSVFKLKLLRVLIYSCQHQQSSLPFFSFFLIFDRYSHKQCRKSSLF